MARGIPRKAGQNAHNITRILVDQAGTAHLYRTITAGPSGQRADKLICSVSYDRSGFGEIAIYMADGPFAGERAGHASRSARAHAHGCTWAIYDHVENDRDYFRGYASSLSLGCDVLINGAHVATGRHDSHRISGGKWVPYVMPKDS